MKSIKKITDDVIDLVHENSYKEIEEWHDEDGYGYEINLSPTPECYNKLNQYFAEILKDMLIKVLKINYNQAGSEIPGRQL